MRRYVTDYSPQIALLAMLLVAAAAWLLPAIAHDDAETAAPAHERDTLKGYLRGAVKVLPLYAQITEAHMDEVNPRAVEGRVVGRTLFGVTVADLTYRRGAGTSDLAVEHSRALLAWLAFIGAETLLAGALVYTSSRVP